MPLEGLITSVVVEVGPLPLGSSLVGKGRVVRIISKSLEDSLPLEGSLGATRGFVVSRTTPLDDSFSFSVALACSSTLEGLEDEGEILVGLPLPSSTFLE